MTNDQPKAPEATEVEIYISNNWGDNSLINDWKAEEVQYALEEFASQYCADKQAVIDLLTEECAGFSKSKHHFMKECADKQAEIDYLKEIIEDKHKLTKYIDDILNGKMAANKPSLIDVIKSIKQLKEKADKYEELKTRADRMLNVTRNSFNLYEPWPITDVLSQLIKATDILLQKEGYDGNTYEEMQAASEVGKVLISKLNDVIKLMANESIDKGK